MDSLSLNIEVIHNGYVVRGSIEPGMGCEHTIYFKDFKDALKYARDIIDKREKEYIKHQKMMFANNSQIKSNYLIPHMKK